MTMRYRSTFNCFGNSLAVNKVSPRTMILCCLQLESRVCHTIQCNTDTSTYNKFSVVFQSCCAYCTCHLLYAVYDSQSEHYGEVDGVGS